MNIYEATKEAYTSGRYISRPDMHCKIRPTNNTQNPALCILMGMNGESPSQYGWQPSAEDLMCLDWEVVD